MSKYESFNKANLKNLRNEMQELLNKYGVDANLDMKVGNMSFSDTEVNIKVSAKVKGAKTFSDTILQTRVDALKLKMKNSQGEELIDYNTRAYKMPFVYKAPNGKMFKCDEQTAKRKFAV